MPSSLRQNAGGESPLHSSQDDARRARRRAVTKSAVIVHGDGKFHVPCTIRDISASGARIQVAIGIAIPDRIYLIDLESQLAFEAVMAWKHLPRCGLRFVAGYKLADLPPQLDYLRVIWLERAAR